MTVVIFAILLLGLGFAGIAVKIWVKEDGEFSGTCSSNNPILNDGNGNCSVCGAAPTEQCDS